MLQHKRAVFHLNDRISQEILLASTPLAVEKLAESLPSSNEWCQIRDDIVSKIMTQKLRISENARKELERSKGRKLVYADRYESYWGCGLSDKVAELMDPK